MNQSSPTLWSFDDTVRLSAHQKATQTLASQSTQEKEDTFWSALMTGDEAMVLACVKEGVKLQNNVNSVAHRLFRHGNVTMFKALEKTLLKPTRTSTWFNKAIDALMLRPCDTEEWAEMVPWVTQHRLWKDEMLPSIWRGTSISRMNQWMKAGGPMAPKIWTPALKTEFSNWLTHLLSHASVQYTEANVSFPEVLRNLTHLLDTLKDRPDNPLEAIAHSSAANDVWLHALFNFGRNDSRSMKLQTTRTALPFLQLFLDHGLMPESHHKTHPSNQDAWTSWSWKAAQYGDKESLDFLLQNPEQCALFKKEWKKKGADCLYNTSGHGVDTNLAIHAIPYCLRFGFDLTPLDSNLGLVHETSVLHVLAHTLSFSATQLDPLVLNQEWMEILTDLRPQMLSLKDKNGYTPWDYVPQRFEVVFEGRQMDKGTFEMHWEQAYLKRSLPMSQSTPKFPRL